MRLKEGTKVKIKDSVDCHEIYKKGGELMFDDDFDLGEKPYGISIKDFGYCNNFKAADYELI